MASGFYSLGRTPIRPLFGESRPAVSDSFLLAAPPEGVGAEAAGKSGETKLF